MCRLKVVLLGYPSQETKGLVQGYLDTLKEHEKYSELLDVTEVKTRVNETLVELTLVEITENNIDSRYAHYEGATLFLVCFDVFDKEAFTETKEKTLLDIRAKRTDTPLFLVGMGIDSRKNPKKKNYPQVSYVDGCKFVREVQVNGYFEVSLKEKKGVWDLFNRTLDVSLKSVESKKSFFHKNKKLNIIFGHEYYPENEIGSHQLEVLIREFQDEKTQRELMTQMVKNLQDQVKKQQIVIDKQQLEMERLNLYIKSVEETTVRRKIQEEIQPTGKSPREIKIYSTPSKTLFSPRRPTPYQYEDQESNLTRVIKTEEPTLPRLLSDGSISSTSGGFDEDRTDSVDLSSSVEENKMKLSSSIDFKMLTKNTDRVIQRRKSEGDTKIDGKKRTMTLGQVPKDFGKGTWSMKEIKNRTFSEPILFKDLNIQPGNQQPPVATRIKSENNVLASGGPKCDKELDFLSPDTMSPNEYFVGSPDESPRVSPGLSPGVSPKYATDDFTAKKYENVKK
jgi:hypothetical protein